MLTKQFVIKSPVGLHARPASILVSEAEKFKSEIILRHKSKEISVKSIIGVMTLGVETGDTLEVSISGEDEEKAMERLEKFFEEELLHL